MKLDRIILVHKTHLDVGFTDLASTVTGQYLNAFIPAAIARARELNLPDAPPRFVWTTGAWIIWKALETMDHAARTDLEEAIAKGWVVWHALPFTFHTELLSPTLFRLALKFSQELDQRFGKKTISAKMTDVPGHTIGMVPLLAEAGIQFLHLGVNPASKVPDVPSLFQWKYQDQAIITAYSGTYGSLTLAEGLGTGLSFLHTNDNLGPPSAESILQEENWLKERFQPREIISGPMDAFARELLSVEDNLPILEQEIGDSWIHGAGTDPAKVADYLALRREVDQRAEEFLHLPLGSIASWLEPLMLVPEHTWGLDVKAWFGDHKSFDVSTLRTLCRSKRFQKMEASWSEQNEYISRTTENAPFPLETLRDSRNARSAPALPESLPFSPGSPIVAGRWLIRIEPATGVLAQVFDRESGIDFCPDDGRLNWGIPHYEQYGEEDYLRFLDGYMGAPPRPWWAEEDFRKIGLPRERRLSSTLRGFGFRIHEKENQTSLRANIRFMGDASLLDAAPDPVAMVWTFHHKKPIIDLHVGWDQKNATRMAEAMWIGFRFPPQYFSLQLQKLGALIDPSTTVKGGGVHLHAIHDKVNLLRNNQPALSIQAHDSVLLSTNGGRFLDPSPDPSPATDTLWFNLLNNIWNTNFRLWNEGPMGFRFRFTLEE